MSIGLISLVFEKSKTRAEGRLVLLALCDNASDEGYCFPKVNTIAKKANVTPVTARLYMKALRSIGVIKRESRWREDGRQTSNGYWIVRERIGLDVISPELLETLRAPSRKRASVSQAGSNDIVPSGVHVTTLEGGACNDVRGGACNDVIVLNRNSNHQINTRGAHKSARQLTPFQLECKRLESLFSEKTNLPAPDWDKLTPKQKKALAVRWANPIAGFIKLANGRSAEMLEAAIIYQRAQHWPISAPQSIEKSFQHVWSETTTSGARSTPELT